LIKDLPINSLDLAVGGVLLLSALLAFVRGFVHEMLSIAAWAGALAAATYGLPYARPFVHKVIPIVWAADAAAAVVIFLAVLLTLSLITHAVSRTIQKSALNNVDRSLGFIFGLLRAVVILGVGLIVCDWLTDRDRPTWVRTAKTLPIIEYAADGIKALVPPSFMAPSAVAKEPPRTGKTTADTKKTFDRLTKPDAAASKEREGYDNKARNDLERLLDATAAGSSTAPATGGPAADVPEKKPNE
jgi:membrane protein required for colicin V production